MEKYVRGVEWLKEILYGIQFSADRLLVVANKMINDVARLVGHTWDPASPPCGEYESSFGVSFHVMILFILGLSVKVLI